MTKIAEKTALLDELKMLREAVAKKAKNICWVIVVESMERGIS